jgi:hypothetical protein
MFTTALSYVVGFGSVVFVGWAFVDAFGFSREDYAQADRLPRVVWLVMLAFGFGLVLLVGGGWILTEPFGQRSITWVAVMLATGIYFYDQRPKLLNARIARDR